MATQRLGNIKRITYECQELNVKRNKVITIEVDWSRPGAGFTYLFETEAMQSMKRNACRCSRRQVVKLIPGIMASVPLLCSQEYG
ncbi:hypothetical protein KHA80_11750 [Anaerobacillus sp. HL2]|nr:hypothetical protein KHA80_11750 [Anaerobacillus sp. HL2]